MAPSYILNWWFKISFPFRMKLLLLLSLWIASPELAGGAIAAKHKNAKYHSQYIHVHMANQSCIRWGKNGLTTYSKDWKQINLRLFGLSFVLCRKIDSFSVHVFFSFAFSAPKYIATNDKPIKMPGTCVSTRMYLVTLYLACRVREAFQIVICSW